MRLDYSDDEKALIARADTLEENAKALRQQATDARNARDRERPLVDRLIFAATARCSCGHGMAYDPLGEARSDKDGPFVMPSQWECSAILTGVADRQLVHQSPLPFAFYELKSENQPSAYGATTRQPADPRPEATPQS